VPDPRPDFSKRGYVRLFLMLSFDWRFAVAKPPYELPSLADLLTQNAQIMPV
jgi:hypothetical protein